MSDLYNQTEIKKPKNLLYSSPITKTTISQTQTQNYHDFPKHVRDNIRNIPQNARIQVPKMAKSINDHQRKMPKLNLPKLGEVKVANKSTLTSKFNNFIRSEGGDSFRKPKKVENDEKLKPEKNRRIEYYSRGGIVLGAGFFMFLLFDPIFQSVLDYNMSLRPNGLATTLAWTKNPIPINSCWYLFSIKNAEAFLQRGAKPFIEEKGPVCYDIYRHRSVIEWTEKTVKFKERFEFVFNKKDSVSRDITLTVINFPIVAAVITAKNLMHEYYVDFLGPLVYNTISSALRMTGEDLVTKITARQLMEGWELNILKYLDFMLKPLRSIGIPVPDMEQGFLGIVNHKFSITGSVSFFEVGPFEAYTRNEDDHFAGQVFKFDNSRYFPYFKAPCNKFGGSDGLFWPKPIEGRNLYLYLYHFCHRFHFVYNQTHYFQGVKTSQYTFHPQMYDMRLRQNRCYCTRNRDWKDCDGWSDCSQCLFGLPIGLSLPHFFNSPRRLAEVDGLTPDATKHTSYLEFETNMGIPALARIYLQGVLDIEPIPSVSALANLPKVKLPVAWVKIYAGADSPVLGTVFFLGANSLRFGSYGILLGSLGLSSLYIARGIASGKRPKK